MKSFLKTRMLHAALTCGAPPHSWVKESLIFLLLFLIASLLQGIILGPFEMVALLTHPSLRGGLASKDMSALLTSLLEAVGQMPAWMTLVQLFSTVGLVGTVLFYVLKVEKRSCLSLGLERRGAVGEYVIGLGIGALLFSGAVAIGCLSGQMTLQWNRHVSVGMIIAFFLGYLVQGFSEELLCRGYFMMSMARGCPVWVCVLSNALLFAVLHLGNPGMTPLAFINLTLFGFFASVYTLRRGSLWGVAALHSIWNFAQGNVFGLSVSGLGTTESLFTATTTQGAAGALIHGGAFGPEGGIAVTMVLAAGALLWLFLPTKKSQVCEEFCP